MKKRYYFLDVFRGATVALMILVNNPGSWGHMYAPLKHASWHGVTPTDLVFPFFLFAVGNAMAFVMPRLREAGEGVFLGKVIKRSILIFLIGLFLSWWPFVSWSGDSLVFREWVNSENPESGVRILGVLQRIAIAYFLASILVFYLKDRALILISGLILLVYWWLCWFFGKGDPYSLAGWFGTEIDKDVLGVAHMYKGEGVPFDPEGLVSTLPAVIQVVFGYLAGRLIRMEGDIKGILWGKLPATDNGQYRLVAVMMVLGFLGIVLGWTWSLGFPLNKKIWTSSYVLYTTGLGMLTIGGMIWFIEVCKAKNFVTRFFDVFGKNLLFIFVLSGLLPRLLGLIRIPNGVNASGEQLYITPFNWFYQNVCVPIGGPAEFGSFLYALFFMVFMWAIVYWMDKKNIYIKV